MRIIIYTGKGGVGKTSVSAATARRLAAKGYRTLAMSTDAAHSLSDSLDVNIGGSVKTIEKNLDALEIDIIYEMETRWKDIEEYVKMFMVSQGMEELSAKEMAILPGMELIAALFHVLDYEKRGTYDVIVVDTAPTAETLRLLSFPDVSQWYMTRLYGLFKKLIGLARFTIGRFLDFPLPSASVLKSLEDMNVKMGEVRNILQDPTRTTIRMVVNPERMVINETKRAYSYICLYGMTVECLIVNRMLPDGAGTGFFAEKLEEQKKYMEMIHHAFDPMKMFFAYLIPTEMMGSEKLDEMAAMMFGDSDPGVIYATESPMRFYTEGEHHFISLKLPFAAKGDIELYRTHDTSLIVQVGSHKRNIELPLVLKDSELMGAEMKDETLKIKFRRKEKDVQ
ncbi:MAG: ArsA family ATPase [Methanomassiliicoccaceae archaeon]|jgi:arsenite-transporting ATPase|nr:ArsA family ATPase [Methanomassiliicoccaceae archaeon]